MENLLTLSDYIDYSDSDSVLVCLTMSNNKEIQCKMQI